MNNFGPEETAAVNLDAAAPILVKATTFVGDAIHKQVGETLKLECLVDGIPPPNIIWYKVKNTVMTSPKVCREPSPESRFDKIRASY